MKVTFARFAPALVAIFPAALLLAGCAPATVSEKKVVQMAYKGTFSDGTVFSQTEEGKPMEFLVGGGFLIPALEKQMLGMKVGDKRTISLKAADAYGEPDPTAIQTVPRARFPGDVNLKVGERYQLNAPGGTLAFVVTALTSTTVTVDFNNPLAGKDLTFEVTVVKIRPATKEELAATPGPAPAASGQATPQQ